MNRLVEKVGFVLTLLAVLGQPGIAGAQKLPVPHPRLINCAHAPSGMVLHEFNPETKYRPAYVVYRGEINPLNIKVYICGSGATISRTMVGGKSKFTIRGLPDNVSVTISNRKGGGIVLDSDSIVTLDGIWYLYLNLNEEEGNSI